VEVEAGDKTLGEVEAGLMSQLTEDFYILIGKTCMGGSSILQNKQGNSQRKRKRCSRSSNRKKGIKKFLNATTALTTAIVTAMAAVSPTAAVAATAVAAAAAALPAPAPAAALPAPAPAAALPADDFVESSSSFHSPTPMEISMLKFELF
jgi:hypothetical protein